MTKEEWVAEKAFRFCEEAAATTPEHSILFGQDGPRMTSIWASPWLRENIQRPGQ
jgi:hypothetical protein